MATSELTSLPRLCDIVWPTTLHFGYVKWLLFTRRVQTNDLFPFATSKPTKITRVKKYARPKSDLSPDLLLSSPPPFKLKYSARTIGLRGNDDTAKCLNLSQVLFNHTSQ